MAKSAAEAEYPIAAVSKLTGVSCHALRVWERRYGYPMPHRSPSGHRRYSPEQVQALRKVVQRIRAGQSIGDLIAEIKAGRLELESSAEVPTLLFGLGAIALVNEPRGVVYDIVNRQRLRQFRDAERRDEEARQRREPTAVGVPA